MSDLNDPHDQFTLSMVVDDAVVADPEATAIGLGHKRRGAESERVPFSSVSLARMRSAMSRGAFRSSACASGRKTVRYSLTARQSLLHDVLDGDAPGIAAARPFRTPCGPSRSTGTEGPAERSFEIAAELLDDLVDGLGHVAQEPVLVGRGGHGRDRGAAVVDLGGDDPRPHKR